MKKRMLWLFTAVLTLGLAGCGGGIQKEEPGYQQITAQEAKTMMDVGAGTIVLDVREQEEYDQGHIPGAVLLPVGEITQESASAAVPEKDTVVLVYCRSGNRSKAAAGELAQLGYSQVYEFGGIQDWPYEIE